MIRFLDNNIKVHILFLLIISLNYIIPYLIFGEITLFYLDALDNEIIYNKIIGEILKNGKEKINIFLNGEIKLEYLRRLLNPYMFIYRQFSLEHAYWIIDILVKLTSYFSFFIFAKKINKNLFYCGLVSCLYASANLPTELGFGLAILPYVMYLILFKEYLKAKYIFILVLFGLNSDFVSTVVSLIPMFFFLLFFLKKDRYFHCFKVLILFIIPIVLTNINLILITLRGDETHRLDFFSEGNSALETLEFFIFSIFQIPNFSLNFSLLMQIPKSLFVVPLMLFFIFFKDKKITLPILIIIFTQLFLVTLKLNYVNNFISAQNNLLNTFSWNYSKKSFLFLYLFSMISILKYNNFFKKIIILFTIFSVFFYQINSSIVPFVKEKILKYKNYQNLYTFNGYYNYFDYSEIKEIIKEDRAISVGVDPFVAVYHNINISDGYHNLYPLSYKKKFRKIIEPELEKNLYFKKYYDEWGSRVYTVLYEPYDKNNIQLNFNAAKDIGVRFIISKYLIKSDEISLVKDGCSSAKNKLCLYSIN